MRSRLDPGRGTAAPSRKEKIMKIELAMTTLKKIYGNVFCTGYCDLQKIMQHYEPSFYNAGVYGWNNDTYVIYADGQSVAISTGYRNTRGPFIHREELEPFNAAADAIEAKYKGQFSEEAYDQKRNEYAALRESFTAYLLNR